MEPANQINQSPETAIPTIEPVKLTIPPKKPRKFIPFVIVAALLLPIMAFGGFYFWTKVINKQNKNSVVSAPQKLGEIEFPEPAPRATYTTSSEGVEYEPYDYSQNYYTGSSNEPTDGEDTDIMIEDDFLDDSMLDDLDDFEDFDIDF